METKVFIKEAHEYSKGKVCSKCNKWYPFNEFFKKARAKDGFDFWCRSCNKERNACRCPVKVSFLGKKSNAKKKGIAFTIEPTDIPGVKIREYKSRNGIWTWEATEYPKMCSKWGIKLDWGMNGIRWNSPSFDRINPVFDYVIRPDGKCNVRIVCQAYNMAKGNCSPDVWDILEKQIGRAILFGNEI